MKRGIVIVGAGPAGLGAGYHLKELGRENFVLFETANEVGGLAGSYMDSSGFTWDVGVHVTHSHYAYFDELFDKLMGEDYTVNERESWVRLMGRWVPYPLQNNIRHLPREATWECLWGLMEAQGRGDHHRAENFQEFIDAVFGEGIGKYFMTPYNTKVWGCAPAMLNKHWIGERVAMVDVQRAIRNVVLERDDVGWGPNNRFKYPLFGGTGEIYRRLGKRLEGHIRLNKALVRIDVGRKECRFADGEVVAYDTLISAVPLDKLCGEILIGDVAESIQLAARRLRHASGFMVGLGIRQPCPSTRSWMYFPESNCPFYRVSYLSNLSPHMTPDKDRYHSLLCETSASDLRPVDSRTVVDETVRGLISAGVIAERDCDDIVDVWTRHVEYSYPVPTLERDAILAEVIPWLESIGIYSRGRFGMWKYEVSNTDHSVMQGVELVDRLLLGKAEQTIGTRYRSTMNGRDGERHEDEAGTATTRITDASAAKVS